MTHTLTTCTFCGVGCGLYLETAGQQVIGVYPSVSHPTNAGRLCVRGWHVHEVAGSPERLKAPQLRRHGRLVEVSWDDALEEVAKRLEAVRQRHGPDAIAFLNSPRSSNEEAYLLQKLARAVLGTNNVDHGAGVYCHNSVDLLLDMLGVPASTNAIAEIAHSDLILVDGVDLARQLPTVAGWVLRARLGGATLVVVDPRRHRVAESADLFLQPLPGTETLLYGAMAKIIADRALHNTAFLRDRCQDADAFLASLRSYDLLDVAERCGVPPGPIEAAALACAQARAASFLYSTADEGRSQDSIASLVNLALLTGQFGREGAGLFALAEHNNLQGICDVGFLPHRLPAYRPVDDPAARAEVEALWETRLPARPGRTAREVLGGPDSGVRAVWLGRYDPVSTAFAAGAERALQAMDFVVVQHLFPTGTAEYAHAVLPCTAFGEEAVTFTSLDRRIQGVRQAIPAPPGLLPAWQQIAQVARRLGARWDYGSSGEVLEEIRRIVPAYRGLSRESLERDYGCPWPVDEAHPQGTRTLFTDPAGTRRFRPRPIPCPAPAAPRDPQFPFTLILGDSLYYWHRNVLIRHSETLNREYRILLLDYPNGFVEMNDADARRLGIRDGERVRLCTAEGCAVAAARVTDEVRAGTAHVPYFLREVEDHILGSGAAPDRQVPVSIHKEAA